MQTVVADMSVGSNKNPRGCRGLQHRRPRRLSGIEVQRFKHVCKKGYRTFDNRTEEIQPSRRTTYKAQECEAVRLVDHRNTERGASVATAAVCMRETGQREDTGMHITDILSKNEGACGSTGPGA